MLYNCLFAPDGGMHLLPECVQAKEENGRQIYMRITEEQAEVQKAQILSAALDVFARDGFSAARLQDIADLAKISRSPIYNYFGDKLGLYKAVVTNFYEGRYAIIRDIFARNDDIFTALAEDFELTCREDACKFLLMTNSLFTELQGEKELIDYVNDINVKIRGIKYSGIARAIQSGGLNPNSNANEIVDIIYVFVNGLLSNHSEWFLGGNNYYKNSLMESLLTMLRTSYGR